MPRGKVIAIGCRCPGRKWHFRDCNHAAGYCKDTAHKYEKAVASLKRQLNVANQKMRENPIVLDLRLLTPVADPEE